MHHTCGHQQQQQQQRHQQQQQQHVSPLTPLSVSPQRVVVASPATPHAPHMWPHEDVQLDKSQNVRFQTTAATAAAAAAVMPLGKRISTSTSAASARMRST